MRAVSHVWPSGSQKSLTGVTVNVKSSFGCLSGGSLKTLRSTPMLESEIVGFIISGPIRTRTVDVSGTPSTVCANAGTAHNRVTATSRDGKVFRTGFLIRLLGSGGQS